MIFQDFFQWGPLPTNQILGTYDLKTVLLSYAVAVIASYLAFDVAERIHSRENSRLGSLAWLTGGAFAMGAGIWSMHFIGMLAFKMPMQIKMEMNPWLTLTSLVIAVMASGFALTLFGKKSVALITFAGGILLGLAIACMHYVGMQAMEVTFTVHYFPGRFILSLVVALLASEAAIWMAIKSREGIPSKRTQRKAISALIMGSAICGMHYIAMSAAVFTPAPANVPIEYIIDQHGMIVLVAFSALCILGIAFVAISANEIANAQAVRAARRQGILEITSTILHNVGNVLNSVNVSAATVYEKLSQSELQGLTDLSELIEKHRNHLGQFLTEDPAGKELPDYIRLLATYWKKEQAALLAEMATLTHHIQHIKDIIATQQSISIATGQETTVIVPDLIEEAIGMSNIQFSSFTIQILRDYEKMEPLLTDKIKLLQILINLIQNAKQALVTPATQDKILSIQTHLTGEKRLVIAITDNGVGISPENLPHLFSYGFTTRTQGHGFGLHASLMAARSLKGDLTAESSGPGKGATFRLELPYRVSGQTPEECHTLNTSKETDHAK